MIDDEAITRPPNYAKIKNASEKLGFNMLSDLKTGSLIRTLAASKRNGHFLELGTGTGLSMTWLAETAGPDAKIVTVDNDARFQQVAAEAFEGDRRIDFHCVDGNQWLADYRGEPFDLVFADAWPGKFDHLDLALAMVKTGGFYLIDDLLPQHNWPTTHPANVERLLAELLSKKNFVQTTFNWSTGLMLFTRIA